MTKKQRQIIYNKFEGKCAYSGTDLEDDWQVDHVIPIFRCYFTKNTYFPQYDVIENMVPCQKAINHYKGALDLENFRNWLLGELHLRLAKFPKKSKSEKTLKRKAYLMKVANYFDIDVDKPFNRVFYFETLTK